MRVLAVDPGPHVGVAFWSPETWAEHEVAPAAFYAAADEYVRWADEVVVEDFVIGGARAQSANETIEMIGVLRYLARLHRKQFTTQMPGDASAFSTKTKLKALGWYKPAKADHARSATRHLVLYLSRKGRFTAEQLVALTTEGGTT